ncbi:MAG: hypothetical protein ABI716_03765, partial [Candidatus Saccharibacteria bacterium]
DIETAVAERLPRTSFVNQVGFEFTGHDFISIKDKVSMDSMTKTNLDICRQESSANPHMARELIRAKSESQEVTKLADWFLEAPINGYMIFESLPIGEQEFAISRIYQKTSASRLTGSFVSLYNSSIDQFNQLRQTLRPGQSAGQDEQEILDNNFEYFDENLTHSTEFIDLYTDTYDRLLQTEYSTHYSFGLETDDKATRVNGIEKVRSQTKLTDIYIDTIKSLAAGQGSVSAELVHITELLGIGSDLSVGQAITLDTARDMLKSVTISIASVIDRADTTLLRELETIKPGDHAGYDALSYYGGQAKSEGASYSSGGCAEYNRSDSPATGSVSEYYAIAAAYSIDKFPDNFGEPKIDVCRIISCPSRGSTSWPEKTLVGGCSICINCHQLFQKGKSPEKIYKEKETQKKQLTDKITKKRAADSSKHEIVKDKKPIIFSWFAG